MNAQYDIMHSGHRSLIYAFMIFFFLTSIVDAATYYVRTDGNDGNLGTANTSVGAWQTIQKCADNITAGDTCRVQSGTYNENIHLTVSGTTGNPIVYLGDNWPVVTTSTKAFYFDTPESHITITGFNIIATGGGGTGLIDTVAGARLQYVNISNNIIDAYNYYKSAIHVYNADNSVIHNNTLKGGCAPLYWGGHGSYPPSSNNVLSNNTINKSISLYASGNCAEDNSRGNAIFMDGYHIRDTVAYNKIVQNLGGGVRYWDCDGCTILYNEVSGYGDHTGFDYHGVHNSYIEGDYVHDMIDLGYVDSLTNNLVGIMFTSWPGHDGGNNTVKNLRIKNVPARGYDSDSTANTILENAIIDYGGQIASIAGFLIYEYPGAGWLGYNWSIKNITVSNQRGNGISYTTYFGGANNWLIDANFINISDENSDCYMLASVCTAGVDADFILNAVNINESYPIVRGASGGTIYVAEYADILVKDAGGNPISGVNVTFTNINDPSIRGMTAGRTRIDSTTTGSDGHTPLPSNITHGIALPYKKLTGSTTIYSWNVTALKSGYSNSTVVVPSSSWYRSNPDTPQNTITITLPTSTGNRYYVRTDGNNNCNGKYNNAGTSGNCAWQTIAYAAQQAQAGDTVEIANGTYSNEHIAIVNSGALGAPITFRGYNGARPLLDGVDDTGVGIVNQYGQRKDYINIKDIRITNYFNGISDVVGEGWNIANVEIYNSSDNGATFFLNNSIFDNLVIHDNVWNGISWGTNGKGSYGNLIKNTIIYNNGHNGFDMKDAGSYGNVFDNVIGYRNGWGGSNQNVYFTNGAHDNTIRNSKFYDAYGHGVEFQGSKNNQLINVTSYSNPNGAAFLIAVDPSFGESSGTVIQDSVAYDSKQGFYVWSPNSKLTNSYAYNITNNENFFIEGSYDDVFIQDLPVGRHSFRMYWNFNKNGTIESTEGKVFQSDAAGLSKPIYYSNSISNMSFNNAGGSTFTVTVYPMTIQPTLGSATITVNKFNTSLPQGQILANFTADTADGNNVVFTANIKPYTNYLVRKDGVNMTTVQADSAGKIMFNNSVW